MMNQAMACMITVDAKWAWLLWSLLLYLFFWLFFSILSWTLSGAHILFLKLIGAFCRLFIFYSIPA